MSASPRSVLAGGRVFETDITLCPLCGGQLRVIADIIDPELIRKILDHAHSRAPPRLPPRRIPRPTESFHPSEQSARLARSHPKSALFKQDTLNGNADYRRGKAPLKLLSATENIPGDTLRNLGIVHGPLAAAFALVGTVILLGYRLDRRRIAALQTDLASRTGAAMRTGATP